jgi:2-iminobutanoate/2-iminopropanoate deaminase
MTTDSVQEISTQKAPAAVGPYSQAVRYGNLVFVSGQLGLDPKTGDFVSPVTAEQARQALKNIQAVLESVGGSMDNVVKVTVFVVDMAEFGAVNEVYAGFFSAPFPARACVEVAALPKGGRVEIEAIASLGAGSPLP